tara:strand:+ start:35 stop:328 length:294 start_codon:yes stop_codon:yes gene_type:complete
MKIKLFKRQVYHKIGMIEIDVPDFVNDEHIHSEVQAWLHNNEDLWWDKLGQEMYNDQYMPGFGMDAIIKDSLKPGFTDNTEETENRYELPDGNGGHI